MGQEEVVSAPAGCKQHGCVCARHGLVGTRWSISVLFGTNELRNKPPHLVGGALLSVKGVVSCKTVMKESQF